MSDAEKKIEHEKKKARAAELRDGPNTIVEDASAPRKVQKSSPAAKASPAPLPGAEERELQVMPLKHFLAIEFGSKKADQGAGFAIHAKKMKPRTILDWRKAFAEFMAKPVK